MDKITKEHQEKMLKEMREMDLEKLKDMTSKVHYEHAIKTNNLLSLVRKQGIALEDII